MKKKNNYKPRIVEFMHRYKQEKHNVDTRLGMCGFYPGDLISGGFGDGYVLGTALSYGDERCLAITCSPNEEGFHFLNAFCLSGYKRTKRHAQRLIDNGEMIQVGEQ
jgi:hypothetical protein